jgi:hypothetical protein
MIWRSDPLKAFAYTSGNGPKTRSKFIYELSDARMMTRINAHKYANLDARASSS